MMDKNSVAQTLDFRFALLLSKMRMFYQDFYYSYFSLLFFFRGVVILEIDLNKTTVNQCEGSITLFAGTHRCRPATTQVCFSVYIVIFTAVQTDNFLIDGVLTPIVLTRRSWFGE